MCEQPEKEEMIGRGEKKKKKKLGQWRRNIYHKSFFVGETNTTRVCDHLFKPRELALQFVLSVTKPTSNGPPHLCVYVMYILCPSLLFSAQFHSKQTHFSSSFFLLLLYQRFPRRSFRLYVSVLSRLLVLIVRSRGILPPPAVSLISSQDPRTAIGAIMCQL